jgi:hypothetical protein
MTHHLSLFTLILKTLEKYILFQISPSAEDKYRCISANLYFFLIIYVHFLSILIVFVSIIFHQKSILAKSYLMSHLLDVVFNFF